MPTKFPIIFYISHSVIDQIYRSRFGPLIETTTNEGSETAKGIAGKLGLPKLAALLTGATLDAEGKIERKSSKSFSRKVIETSEDRAIQLITELFQSQSHDIAAAGTNFSANDLYTFTLPVTLIPKKATKTRKALIEVRHNSGALELSGVTSEANWISPSYMNTLLWEAARRRGLAISGIFLPVSVELGEAKKRIISCQFLVLFSSETFIVA